VRRTSSLGLAAALAGASLACTQAVERSAVTSEPIAFVRVEPKAGITNVEDFMAAVTFANADELEEKRKRKPVRTTLVLYTVPTGEMRALPDAGGGSIPLDWSADGVRLLVGKQSQRGGVELSTWNRLTGAYDALTPARSEGWASLADGPVRVAFVGRIFASGVLSNRAILLYTLPDGTTALADGAGGSDPDVAPDGRTILFVRPGRSPAQPGTILVSDMDATQARALARGDFARFSRDGRWITYVARTRGNRDVWVMRADGTAKRAITRSRDDELYPTLSPDGSYVAYSSVRRKLGDALDESQIFLARVSDGYEIQLTSNGQNSRPVW
jgi:hypothetical protein